jgi:hypothetical protein
MKEARGGAADPSTGAATPGMKGWRFAVLNLLKDYVRVGRLFPTLLEEARYDLVFVNNIVEVRD